MYYNNLFKSFLLSISFSVAASNIIEPANPVLINYNNWKINNRKDNIINELEKIFPQSDIQEIPNYILELIEAFIAKSSTNNSTDKQTNPQDLFKAIKHIMREKNEEKQIPLDLEKEKNEKEKLQNYFIFSLISLILFVLALITVVIQRYKIAKLKKMMVKINFQQGEAILDKSFVVDPLDIKN